MAHSHMHRHDRYTHTPMHAHMHARICVCTPTHECMHACMHTHTHTHTHTILLHICVETSMIKVYMIFYTHTHTMLFPFFLLHTSLKTFTKKAYGYTTFHSLSLFFSNTSHNYELIRCSAALFAGCMFIICN